MQVLIPTDKNFNYSQCKKLYENNQHLIEDYEKFDNVISHTFFYSFLESGSRCRCNGSDELALRGTMPHGKHIGCIYYYEMDNKLYVNAVAYRKTHLINMECFKKSLSWWNCDIYARTHHKTAIYTILKCGFKKVANNLYKYER